MFNIAFNTFKEIVRNKFLYLIVFFASIFIVFSLALWKLTIGEDDKVIIDFGLAMIEIFGLVWVLFVGSQLLFREIEGKTIFLILSKPIQRKDFILGKFLWFSFTILLITFIESLLFFAVLLLKGIEIEFLMIVSLFFILFKLEIILGLVFFFSTFMSHILSILVTLMIYVISHGFSLLLDMFYRTQSFVLGMCIQVFQLLFPPFEALNTKDFIGSYLNIGWNYVLFNTFYSCLYLLLLLFFSVLIFERKKFED